MIILNEISSILTAVFLTFLTYVVYTEHKPHRWFDFDYCQTDELIVYISIILFSYYHLMKTLISIIFY